MSPIRTITPWPAAICAGLLSVAAGAAEPASGTLSFDPETESAEPVEYGGGPFTALNPTPTAGEPSCLDPVFPCDQFMLTVELPEDFNETHPDALIVMTFDWNDPNGSGVEDYDFYLYEGDVLITKAATAERPEVMLTLPFPGTIEYRVQATPYSAVGSSYHAVIELFLEDPFADDDEEFRSQSVAAQGGGAFGAGLACLTLMAALARLRRRAV